MSSSLKTTILLTGVALVFLILGIVIANQLKPAEKKPVGITSIGGEFTLQSADGPVSLSDFSGKVAAIYFGYASCPDVCPTSLGLLSSAIRSLDKQDQALIQPIFISVDPERDTPEKLKDYAMSFHDSMIGLTGSKEQIDNVTSGYRMLYKIVPMENSAIGYTVDHASIIYIIGKNGIVQSVAQHGTTPAELAEKLKAALYQQYE